MEEKELRKVSGHLHSVPWGHSLVATYCAYLPKVTGYCSKSQGETQEGDIRSLRVIISTRDIPNLVLYQSDQLLRFGMEHTCQLLVLVLQL